MLDQIQSLIGSPPPGYEWMQYVFVGVALLLIIKLVVDVFFSILKAVFKW